MPLALLSRFSRTERAFWQRGLRRYARLQLALDEPGVHLGQLHACLRVVEQRLLWQLQHGAQPLVANPQQARTLVAAALAELLCSPAAVVALRGELSAAQALSPPPELR